MMTMPETVSPWPSRITAPWRGSGSVSIVATCFSRTGMPLRGGDDDIAQVVDALRAAQAADGVLLLRMLDVAAAEVGVVVRHGGDHIVQRQVVAAQVLGSTSIVYCLVSPPQELISLTPGTVSSA